MKWDDIAKRLPGRSAISCRLRYQNYSEKRQDWDEEKKNKLARLYNRYDYSIPVISSPMVLSLTIPQIQANDVGDSRERNGLTMARNRGHPLGHGSRRNGFARKCASLSATRGSNDNHAATTFTSGVKT